MKLLIIELTLITSLFSNLCYTQFKVPKQHFNDLFNEQKYRQAFLEAKDIRSKEYGKCCLIDYYIAKALCLDRHYDPAQKRFFYILDNYKLQGRNLQFILNKRDECNTKKSQSIEEFYPANMLVLNNLVIPVASVSGKLGKVANCNQHYAPVIVEDSITAEELSSRIFEMDRKTEALKKIDSLLPSEYKVDTAGRYILVTMKNFNVQQNTAKGITSKLNEVINFYSSSFSIRPSDKLITAYLLPDQKTLVNTARIVHGIKIPSENYGYSCLGDLSLVGLSDLNRIGTLKHELFHMAIRTDIGDIPAWLDEGTACLYETSEWNKEHTQLKSTNIDNWRLDVLKNCFRTPQLCTKLPMISELINYSWKEFDASDDSDICKAAINYALAKHLMMYFEQGGKLKDIITAFKNRYEPQWDADSSSFQSNTEILEKALSISIDSVESGFNNWLYKTYHFSFFPPKPPIPTKPSEQIHVWEFIGPHFTYKENYRNAIKKINDERIKADSTNKHQNIIIEAETKSKEINNSYKHDLFLYDEQMKNIKDPNKIDSYTYSLFEKVMKYNSELEEIISSFN